MDSACLFLGILSLFFNPLGLISLAGLSFANEFKKTNGSLNGIAGAGFALNMLSFIFALLVLLVSCATLATL